MRDGDEAKIFPSKPERAGEREVAGAFSRRRSSARSGLAQAK